MGDKSPKNKEKKKKRAEQKKITQHAVPAEETAESK